MERRTFLRRATHGLGALFGVLLGVPAIAYLLHPLRKAAPPGEYRSTGVKLSELVIGTPRQAVLRNVRRDGWTLHPNDVIGRVWLLRRDEKTVEAFTTICPHLGCSVNHVGDRFICPCHNGTFLLSGERVGEAELARANPAPRGMDSLPVAPIQGPDDLVMVEYKNFRQGIAEKVEKT